MKFLAVYIVTCITILHGFRGMASFIASGDRVKDLIAEHVLQKSISFTGAWSGLEVILARMYGKSIVGRRSVLASVLTSVVIFGIFITTVVIIHEIPHKIDIYQYVVAALILNVIGDFFSLAQTRILLRSMEKNFKGKFLLTHLIFDFVLSLAIFMALYLFTIRVNMWVAGSNEEWLPVVIRSLNYNIGMQNEVSALFLAISLASCLLSTAFHLFYYVSINLYGKLIGRLYSKAEISKDISGHFSNGLTFLAMVIMFVFLLYSLFFLQFTN